MLKRRCKSDTLYFILNLLLDTSCTMKEKVSKLTYTIPPPLFVNATHYEWQDMNLIQK